MAVIKETFKLEGVKEAIDNLKGLPPKLKGAAIQSVLKRGLAPVQRDLQNAAPVSRFIRYRKVRFTVKKTKEKRYRLRSNKLRNNILITGVRSRFDGVQVGVSNKAFWARFIEFGTTKRQTRKTGANRGTVTKKPFIERIYDASVPKLIDFINVEMGKISQRYLEKKAKTLRTKRRKLGI